jgi:hypothetical protein
MELDPKANNFISIKINNEELQQQAIQIYNENIQSLTNAPKFIMREGLETTGKIISQNEFVAQFKKITKKNNFEKYVKNRIKKLKKAFKITVKKLLKEAIKEKKEVFFNWGLLRMLLFFNSPLFIASLMLFFWRRSILNHNLKRARRFLISFWVFFSVYLLAWFFLVFLFCRLIIEHNNLKKELEAMYDNY